MLLLCLKSCCIVAAPAGLPLLLGVIKCGVRITSRINGFLIAEPTTSMPLIDGPIITYDTDSAYEPEEMAAMVTNALQQQQALGNPVICRYLTVMERAAAAASMSSDSHDSSDPAAIMHDQNASDTESDDMHVCSSEESSAASSSDMSDASSVDEEAAHNDMPRRYAVPVLPATAAEHISLRAQVRDTTAGTVEETQRRQGIAAVVHTGALVEPAELQPCKRPRYNYSYFAGEVQRRESTVERVLCTATGLTASSELTVELAIFPYLFPSGGGFFDGGINFAEYIKMRSLQLFSRFTLVKEYLLVMIQASA